MVDYKAMYEELFVASEDAIQRLIQAQRKCEAIFADGTDEKEG